MLKNSRIVITDSSSGLTEIIRGLQQHVKDHPQDYLNRSWDECFPMRFLVMKNTHSFHSLKQMLQYGSVFEQDEDVLTDDLRNLG